MILKNIYYLKGEKIMEATRRERKKEAAKANIMQTAINLFEKQGFAATTMNQIAEEADVAMGTLYNYFTSKEAFVGEYMRQVVEEKHTELGEELQRKKTTYEKLKFYCDVAALWAEQNRTLMEIYCLDPWNYYFGPTEMEVPRSGLDEVITGIFAEGQRKGEIRQDYPDQLLTRQFMSMHYFALLTWLANPEENNLQTLFNDGLELVLRGMVIEKADAGTILWGMFC